MPWPLRAAFGVFVSAVFGFVGAGFLESNRIIAYILIGMAALRFWAVVRMVAWYLRGEDEEPISEELRALDREMDAATVSEDGPRPDGAEVEPGANEPMEPVE